MGQELNANQIVEMLNNINLQYYRGLDPFFYFVLSEMISTGSVRNHRLKKLDAVVESHPVISSLTDAASSKENYQKTIIRLLRYFSSENLVLLLLSGKPNGIFYDISTRLRGKKLIDVFEDLSNGLVPKQFALSIGDVAFDFEEWLAYMIFGMREKVDVVKKKRLDQAR